MARIWKNESGQVLALTALSLTVLMGFMGLAIDVGLLFRTQRQMQIAADAAAVAGALDYKYNASDSSAVTQGCDAATANGVSGTCTTGACSSSVSGPQVCIMTPPADGPNAGTKGLVEAIVTDPHPTLFMRVFHVNTMTVSGRAVAGAIGAGSGCVMTLARLGTDIGLSGSAKLNALHCDVYDNSGSAGAISVSGSASVTAQAIGIAGGSDSISGSASVSPAPVTGMAPIADPLANLPVPSPTNASNPNGCTASTNSAACNPSCSGSSTCSIGPGTYTSIQNSGSSKITLTDGNYYVYGSVSSSGSRMTIGAGNFYIGGNFGASGSAVTTIAADQPGASDNGTVIVGGSLNFSGSSSLSSVAEAFYLKGSGTVSGSGGLNLTAPTSGTYDGILFFQSRTDTDALTLSGSAGSNVSGIVYAPDAPMTLSGSSAWTVSLDVIVDSLAVSGSATTTVTDYASTVNTSSVLGANYGTALTAKTAMVE